MFKPLGAFVALLIAIPALSAQSVDYSVAFVPEENSLDLVKITRESDYVCMPTVKRSGGGVKWLTNRVLGVSPDGKELAYLSMRNGTTNIFIKDIDRQSASSQRTNRAAVMDFAYSPDGKSICFSEAKGNTNQIFMTDAHKGYVCRQITSGAQDYGPAFSHDLKTIFFTRMEKRGSSIWGYDINQNYLASYTVGMNPMPAMNDNYVFVVRETNGKGEIWRVDLNTGVEDCVVSDSQLSFASPRVSPDGTKLALVGGSKIESGNIVYYNTDIYTCNVDGTGLMQLTYHAADDLSPEWSGDGRYIYFISQRGSAEAYPNVWRMNSNL